jgi:hypothetical protein
MMSCCNKTMKNIVNGMFLASISKLMHLPNTTSKWSIARLTQCQNCTESTWISISQYIWFLNNNGIVNVIKNLDDLSALPPIPKQNYKPGAKLFCSICKCWIPAKVRVQDEKCPLNKWIN